MLRRNAKLVANAQQKACCVAFWPALGVALSGKGPKLRLRTEVRRLVSVTQDVKTNLLGEH